MQRFVNRNWLWILWSWFILRLVSWDLGLNSQINHFKKRPLVDRRDRQDPLPPMVLMPESTQEMLEEE